MLLRIRHGNRLFEIDVPQGSRLESSHNGRSVLLIPGPSPADTSTWLPAPSILQAACQGRYGLSLRGEREREPKARPRHAMAT